MDELLTKEGRDVMVGLRYQRRQNRVFEKQGSAAAPNAP
jgi:hypothetical protein